MLRYLFSHDPDRPLAGVIWMLITGGNFVAVTALVKAMGQAVPPAEAAFLRYALGLVFVLPMLPALRRAALGRRGWGLAAARGGVHTFGVALWFYAMTVLPLAEVTALNYLSPIFITIGAALFLGESLAARRIAAVGVAFLGALVILRPGFREIMPGHVAMLGTATSFAVSYMIAKRLSAEHSATVVVALLSIGVTIGLAPLAALVWVTPTPGQLAGYFAVAAFATAGHYTMTLAFRAAPMTVTQPVTFLQLVWALLVGWALFGEPVDGFVVLGGAMIMAAVVFITLREAQLNRRNRTPHPGQANH